MITWDDVVRLAPALDAVEQDAQDLILSQVGRLVPAATWGDLVDIGQTYLAAHLGTILLRTSTAGGSSSVGPVISETVGQVSRTYALFSSVAGLTASLGTTDWGREFTELRKALPSHFGLVL